MKKAKRIQLTRATLTVERAVWNAVRRVSRREGRLVWSLVREMAEGHPMVGHTLREIEGAAGAEGASQQPGEGA